MVFTLSRKALFLCRKEVRPGLYTLLFKVTEWLLGGKGSLDRLANAIAGGEE